MTTKSTVEEIRDRFDHDVDRFSNLDIGQEATIDAPLVMELIPRRRQSCRPMDTICLISVAVRRLAV